MAHNSAQRADLEASSDVSEIPYWRIVVDHGIVTPEMANHKYPGSGTEEDPYIISFLPNDPRNPMLWSKGRKWSICLIVAMSVLAVAFASSAYTGGIEQVIIKFHASTEVVTLGVS